MLIDSYGRAHDYLRISITDKCNLRCSYCIPYDLPHGFYANSQRLTPEEIYTIAKVFVGLGVKKIRITGGEPLVRKECRRILQILSELPVEIVLSSNGVLIDEFLDDLIKHRISSVNISLDSLKEETFNAITRRNQQKRVLANINLLLKHNFHVKINTVAMRGVNDHEFVDFVAMTQNSPLDIRFIEYMPFIGNGWSKEKVITKNEILDIISDSFSYDKIEDAAHSTSKNFRVKNGSGTFGIITTMSEPFCGDCNRLRLTADGKIKNCLFGKEEIDLMTALRNGEDIISLIYQSVKNKYAVMGGQFDKGYQLIETEDIVNRSMIGIGG